MPGQLLFIYKNVQNRPIITIIISFNIRVKRAPLTIELKINHVCVIRMPKPTIEFDALALEFRDTFSGTH